jgi:hypothetical protein
MARAMPVTGPWGGVGKSWWGRCLPDTATAATRHSGTITGWGFFFFLFSFHINACHLMGPLLVPSRVSGEVKKKKKKKLEENGEK